MHHRRILIADDNRANAELLEAYFAGMGDVSLEFAGDGEETLRKVEEFLPDLVLLDVMMPRLNGFEVCRAIKERNPRVLVLMVTALGELGDIERAVEARTDDFLSKPVVKAALLKRVETLLRLKDVQDENERLRRYIQDMEG